MPIPEQQTPQDPDPLAAYRARRSAPTQTPAAGDDDPLAAFRASKAAKGNEQLHAEYRSGALAKRMASENARDVAADRAAEPGPVSTALQSVGRRLANVRPPGGEFVQAGLRSVIQRQPYREALNDIRSQTSQIGGVESFAEHLLGAGALAPIMPGGIVAGGAAYGAADEALDADPDRSLTERGVRTALGAAGGAVAGRFLHDVGAPAIRGASRLASRVLPERAGQFITRLTGAGPVGAEAESREMLRSALLNGGVSPTAAAATVPLDQPTSMMELGSRSLSKLVRTARNVPASTAGQTTDRFLTERAAGTGKRIERALTQATGHTATDTFLPVEQLVDQRAAEARPAYEKAYAYGEIKNPETVAQVQELLKDPVFARAWQRGQALGKLEGSAATPRPPAGVDPNKWNALLQEQGATGRVTIPETQSPAITTAQSPPPSTRDAVTAFWQRQGEAARRNPGTETVAQRMARSSLERHGAEASIPPIRGANPGAQTLTPARTVPVTNPAPTVRQLDLWKRGLDAVVQSGFGSENAISRTEARAYRNALNDVLGRIDEEVPAYKEARGKFRGHSEMMEAAEAGAQHFSPSTPTGALERQLSTLPANEREAYTNNALNKLVEQVRRAASNPDLPESGRGTNIVQRIMGTEDAGQRLGMLFPDEQGFQTFLKRMEDEALYPKTNAFMRGQSSTNEQSAESNTPARTWMDLARSPFSGHARARLVMRAAEGTLGREPKLSTEQANAVGRHATATGMRLKQILMQMDADHAARELGRKRLNTALRGGLIGGEGVSNESRRRFWNDDQPHPDIPRR